MSAFGIAAIAAIPLIAVGITAALTKNMDSTKTLTGETGFKSMKEGGGLNTARMMQGLAEQRKLQAEIIKTAQKPIIQRLEMRWAVVGWEQAQKVRAAIDAIKALADRGIQLNLKNLGGQGPAALGALRVAIMDSLHVTQREATSILNQIAGKKLNFTYAKQFGDELAKTKEKVQSAGGAIVKDLLKHGQDGGKNLAKGLNAGQGPTKAAARGLTTASAVTGVATKLIAEGRKASAGLASGLGKTGPTKTAAAKLKAAANVKLQDGDSLGSALGAGLAAGMMSQVGPTRAAAAALGAASVLPIKNWIQPGSPSRVTLRYGRSLAEGLAAGMKDGKPKAISAASDLAQSILSVMESVLGIGAAIGQMKEQGLPSNKIAKQWAGRVAKMVKAIYAAMKREIGGAVAQHN